MEILKLNDLVHILHGSVNMGLVSTDNGLVAVDTGLDKQSGKQLLRSAKELGLPIVGIINTHAHADHFGGNDTILTAKEVPVYAPAIEADVISRPLYEPEYLWNGAAPLPELRNKFLEARPSPVQFQFEPGDTLLIDGHSFQTVSLHGHSVNQAGIYVHGVFFAADSYFAAEVTDKHGIPYLVDYEKTLQSAELVIEKEAQWYVPGHGRPTEDVPIEDVNYLKQRHEELLHYTVSLVREGPVSMETIIEKVCAWKEVRLTTVGSYVLVRTAISAYITSAVAQGVIEAMIHEGRLMIRARWNE